MKHFIFSSLFAFLLSASAVAGDFDLTPECKSSLEASALAQETSRLAALGDKLASTLRATAFFSHWPLEEEVVVGVALEDEADGRSVSYVTKALKTDALACRLTLKRKDKSACRYSHPDGPEGFNKIAGLQFVSGPDLQPDSSLTQLQQKQIRAFLGNAQPDENVSELIAGTDDGELSTGTLKLPGGRELEYFGAYGGDNPFGVFFEQGTVTEAGRNGDGSVCVN